MEFELPNIKFNEKVDINKHYVKSNKPCPFHTKTDLCLYDDEWCPYKGHYYKDSHCMEIVKINDKGN